MEPHAKKKGWLSLSSSTVLVAVLYVIGSIILTIILLVGVNPLFASSSFPMPGMMGKNMGMQNMTNQMPGMMGKNMGMQNMMTMMGMNTRKTNGLWEDITMFNFNKSADISFSLM